MFTSSHYQLIAQLILKLEEGSAICSWGSRCNGDLVGKNLNEGFSYWLMCAGIAYMDLQRYFCNDKQPQWLSLEKLLQEAAVRKHQHATKTQGSALTSHTLVPGKTCFPGLLFTISGGCSFKRDAAASVTRQTTCSGPNLLSSWLTLPVEAHAAHTQLGSISPAAGNIQLMGNTSVPW